MYQVKYTASINGTDYTGYDYVRIKLPEDSYSGVGK